MAVFALVLIAAAVAVWSPWDGPAPRRPLPEAIRHGAPVIDRTGPLVIDDRPDRYRIVYQVDDYAGADHIVSTDVVHVDRPFSSVAERRSGPPPGDGVVSEQITTFGRLSVPGGGGTQPATAISPPTLAGADLRFAASLAAAVDAGLVRAREWRQVGERDCRVHRTGGPAVTGDLVPHDPDDAEYADICVDEAGLLLEELWVVDGRAMRRKLAVEVEPGAALPDDALEHVGTPASVNDGGGSVRELTTDSRPPGTSWEPTWVPEGFELRGRYAVVPPQPELGPQEGGRRQAGVVDVWTRGIDVIILDQGSTVGGTPVFAPDPDAPKVDAGQLGTAEVHLSFRLNEVRAILDRGHWVRVLGTISTDDLAELARRLERVEHTAGSLSYLD